MIRNWIILIVLSGIAPVLRAGEALDRIVATVNGHALLQSDWDDEVRYECFMSGRAIRDLSAEDRKSALDRLTDQELLREQMRSPDFKPVATSEIEKQIEALKADYARDHDGQSWSAGLTSYGLTEAIIKSHLEVELDQLRLVDTHLRPLVQIDPAEIETYYKEKFVPTFGSATPTSLQEAAPKIREVLVQQKINGLLTSWLDTLHTQAQVRILSPTVPGDSK